jgi:hypothetical protein
VSTYLGTALRTLLTLVVLAGGVNFVVDPGEVLLRGDVDGAWFARYAADLAQAPFGLPYVGASRERGLKRVLAARRADCHVIGSSRASQLSSVRGGAIRRLCPRLVNLWVPGASLEDVTLLAWRSLASGTPRVVLALDPWMLDYDVTPGWRSQDAWYAEAMAGFGLPAPALPRTPAEDHVLAAFSLSSLFASLTLLAEHGRDPGALYRPAVPAALPPFDLRRGLRVDVTLPDGSRVYRGPVLADARRGRMQPLPPHDVPRTVGFDPAALAQLDAVVARLVAEGREPVLLRVPFHPDVFRDEPERVAAYLAPAEARFAELAARHGLATYGSYDPREVGCRRVEFKDLRHPLPECLDRIDWSSPRRPRPGGSSSR